MTHEERTALERIIRTLQAELQAWKALAAGVTPDDFATVEELRQDLMQRVDSAEAAFLAASAEAALPRGPLTSAAVVAEALVACGLAPSSEPLPPVYDRKCLFVSGGDYRP